MTDKDNAAQAEVETKPVPRRARKERPMTKADWEKVHNANVRAERDPDPAQINILDVIASS